MSETEDVAKKEFELTLSKTPPSVFSEYSKLLLGEQVRLANENGGKPVEISIDAREELLKQAKTNIYIGHVDSKKMNEAWEKASRGGRGPIGGAPDD